MVTIEVLVAACEGKIGEVLGKSAQDLDPDARPTAPDAIAGAVTSREVSSVRVSMGHIPGGLSSLSKGRRVVDNRRWVAHVRGSGGPEVVTGE